MEREFTIETKLSSTKETTCTLIVWCKSYDGSDNKIEAAIYDMPLEELKVLWNLINKSYLNSL